MGLSIIIAEKPSVAKNIADALKLKTKMMDSLEKMVMSLRVLLASFAAL